MDEGFQGFLVDKNSGWFPKDHDKDIWLNLNTKELNLNTKERRWHTEEK